MAKKGGERKEALLRIVIGIVSGIVLGIWRWFIAILAVLHWIYVIFTGKRKKGFAELCETWNTQVYVYLRYLTFVTNERPFPFTELTKRMSNFK